MSQQNLLPMRIPTTQDLAVSYILRRAIGLIILGSFSVIINSIVISFTSDFPPICAISIAVGGIFIVTGVILLRKYNKLRTITGNAIPQQSPQHYNIQQVHPQQQYQMPPPPYNSQQPYPQQQCQTPPQPLGAFADQQHYPQQTYNNQQPYNSNLTSSHHQVNAVFADNPPPYEFVYPAGPSSEDTVSVDKQENSVKNNDQVKGQEDPSLPSTQEEANLPPYCP